MGTRVGHGGQCMAPSVCRVPSPRHDSSGQPPLFIKIENSSLTACSAAPSAPGFVRLRVLTAVVGQIGSELLSVGPALLSGSRYIGSYYLRSHVSRELRSAPCCPSTFSVHLIVPIFRHEDRYRNSSRPAQPSRRVCNTSAPTA
jgi:hypothetical protein